MAVFHSHHPHQVIQRMYLLPRKQIITISIIILSNKKSLAKKTVNNNQHDYSQK